MCLKESCVPDCWKVSSVVPVSKNVEERSAAKNYRPVSLLSVVSKDFQKLVKNRVVDHLEKYDLFSDFQYGFRSFRSTANLLTVVSDRIARAYNRPEATPFFIKNQKFKRSPRKSLIFKQFLNDLPETSKRRTLKNPLLEQAKTLFLLRKPKINSHFWTCQFKSVHYIL